MSKFEGKPEYFLDAKMCGFMDGYADTYHTKSLLKVLFKFIIFRFKYPMIGLAVGGQYSDCENCDFQCDKRHDKSELK